MIISELKSLTMLIIIMKMVMTKMAMVKMRMMLNMIVMMFTLVKKMMNMNMMMMCMMVNMTMLTSGFGGSVAANWRSVLSGGQMLATDSLPHDDDGDHDDGDDDDGDHDDGGDVNLGKVASWRVLKANLSTSMFLTQLNLRVPSLWISI